MLPLKIVDGVEYSECEHCGGLSRHGLQNVYWVFDINQDWCEKCVFDLYCCDKCGISLSDENLFTIVNDEHICPNCTCLINFDVFVC
jgi:hypothetical protein